MTAPRFALCQPEKLNGKQLAEVIAEMPFELLLPWEHGFKPTVAQKRAFVTQCKTDYWNSTPKSKTTDKAVHSFGAKTKERTTRLCTITATECNAWLATLPPTPLYGEHD